MVDSSSHNQQILKYLLSDTVEKNFLTHALEKFSLWLHILKPHTLWSIMDAKFIIFPYISGDCILSKVP